MLDSTVRHEDQMAPETRPRTRAEGIALRIDWIRPPVLKTILDGADRFLTDIGVCEPSRDSDGPGSWTGCGRHRSTRDTGVLMFTHL